MITCEKAAAKTGWYPFDEEAAIKSAYAQDRSDAEAAEYMNRRRERCRSDINGRIINIIEFIEEIISKMRNHPHLHHLVLFPNVSEP